MNAKLVTKRNEYELNGDVAYLKLHKKDGTTINAIIDAEDLTMVIEKGIWFAEWHKDYNNFLVQTLNERYVADIKHIEKQTIQSFLLDVHTKAHIIHLNGDTLDNRRCNLELYNQNKLNDFKELDAETVAIILKDKYGKERKSLIDKEDLERVISLGYGWLCHKVGGELYAVANTPDGRVFLNRYIMQTPENEITHAINLNTLDNRKVNIENIIVIKKDETGDTAKKF